MTQPTSKEIVLKVAEVAEKLDTSFPGWARRVPLTKVDISRVETSPMAFLIGPDWDQKITSASALAWMVYTPFQSVAEVANGAWQRQVSLRRANLAPARVA